MHEGPAQPDNGYSRDASALEALHPQLYEHLRELARRALAGERAAQTLNTTALVHEAWLGLGASTAQFESRAHFLGYAATAMRHILVDAARARLALKRGGGQRGLPLEKADNVADEARGDDELVRLDDALRDLAIVKPNLAKLVDCRFFGGLTDGEAAKIMGVSDRTIQRWWGSARAWIHSELEMAG